MKITAPAGVIARAIALVGTGMRGKMPAAARPAAAEGRLTITCSDLHISVSTSIAAEVIEPGHAAVPADKFAALVSGFPAGATITVGTSEKTATVVSGNSRSRLQTVNNLPDLIAIENPADGIEITGLNCLELLAPLAVAPGEKTRFYLSGVYWHTVGDML